MSAGAAMGAGIYAAR
jgi:ubiquitin-protein ligase